MEDVFDEGRYEVTVIRVPQVPVDNQHDIVVVYDKVTKRCACSNKYKSQFKNKHSAIGNIIAEDFN